MKKSIHILILTAFLGGLFNPMPLRAEPLVFPTVTSSLSNGSFLPVLIKGLRVNPKDPLRFEFILDTGSVKTDIKGDEFRKASVRLIRYFLASLTVPDDEMWVNLSPYEKNRVIAQGLGRTDMGRDMLAQDYLLKRLASSLIHPDKDLGKKFWQRVYAQAREKYGRADLPVESFNKVWIVPDHAEVYEKGNTAYVSKSTLKVLTEKDYNAFAHQSGKGLSDNDLSSDILKELIIPQIEREVNEGESFSTLRQIYHSMILAVWYKKRLEQGLLAKAYTDRNKINGIDINDSGAVKRIYQQYVSSFKKGVFNYIREEEDPVSGELLPRKYFSGGLVGISRDNLVIKQGGEFPQGLLRPSGSAVVVDAAMTAISGDQAEDDLSVIKAAMAAKLGVDLTSADEYPHHIELVERLSRVESVTRRFLESQEKKKKLLSELLASVRGQGPPKVTEIHFTSPPNWSGVDIVIAEEVKWLAKQGFPVKIISSTANTPPDSDNVNYVHMPELKALAKDDPILLAVHENRATPDFDALRDLIYQKINAQIEDQDIIILQNVMTVRDNLPFTAALDRIIKENPKKQFIIYVHNAEDGSHAEYPLNILNPVLKLPNVRYATVSDHYRDDVLAVNYALPSDHFAILNPGVHPYSPLMMTQEAIDDFKKNGLLGKDKVVSFAFPTRVAWNKDIGKVFVILEGLKASMKAGVKLIIAAPGIDSFDKLVEDVRSKVGKPQADFLESKRSLAESNMVFLNTARITDYQAHRQYIRDVMALSDFLIYPTVMETFGMFVLEAATAGTGIIATNVPPHVESMGDQEAFLFDNGVALEPILEEIERRISAHADTQDARDKTQRNVLDRYDWTNLMENQLSPLLSAAVANAVISANKEGERLALGDSLMEAGYVNAAKAVYLSLVSNGGLGLLEQIGVAQEIKRKGHMNAARAIYENIVRLDRRNTQARYEMALIDTASGEFGTARSIYLEILNIDPANEHARTGLESLRVQEDKAMVVKNIAKSKTPDIERMIVEGDTVNRVVRYDKDKVSAHIAVNDHPNVTQEITIAMPNKDSENAFYIKASSDEGDFKWNAGSVSSVVTKEGFRGVEAQFSADKNSVNFNFADPSNIMLSDVIDLRMFRFYDVNVPEQERRLVKHLLQLSPEHQRQLEEMIGVPLTDIIIPTVTVDKKRNGSHVISVVKTTFDGRHHYRLFIEVPKGFAVTNNNGSIKIEGQGAVSLKITALTDFDPVTPVPMEKIFNADALKEMGVNPDFETIAKNFAILFYQEKLMAGSWSYLAYFGRDTLVGARLMWTALTPLAKMIIVRSVLDRVGKSAADLDVNGLVAVNDETSQERYFHLNVTQRFIAEEGSNPDVLGMYKGVLANPKRGVLVYNVLDNTFLLPGVEKLLFDDLTDAQLKDFLDLRNVQHEKNLVTILRHWNKVLQLTDDYTRAFEVLRAKYRGLPLEELVLRDEFKAIAVHMIKKRSDTGDANWRDSPYALGWGDYAADINIALAPISLANIESMLAKFERLGLNVERLASEQGFGMLKTYAANSGRLMQDAREAWSLAQEHFKIRMDKEEVRSKLRDFLNKSHLSYDKKQTLRRTVISKPAEPVVTVQNFIDGKTPAWLENGFSFSSIALHRKILHSDETYALLDQDLDSADLNRILDQLFSPYPVGLWNDDVGLFIANAIFVDDEAVLREFDKIDAYHGQNVVWSKAMRELTWGLIRQIRYAIKQGRANDAERLNLELMKVIKVSKKIGDLGLSEVWTWHSGQDGRMKAAAFHQIGGQPAGNPQLWGNSDVIRQPEYINVLKGLADSSDKAMSAPGGIDLDPRKLELKTKGQGLELDWDNNLRDSDPSKVRGIVPVIVNITAVNSLLLGDAS